MRTLVSTSVAAVLAIFTAACGGGSTPAPEKAAAPAAVAGGSAVNLDKNAYPAFPDPDTGADATVPAEQGGRGFKGEGWETNTDYDLIGDPRAVKGGVFRDLLLEFPGTLRIYGPEIT